MDHSLLFLVWISVLQNKLEVRMFVAVKFYCFSKWVLFVSLLKIISFSGGSDGKEVACNAGDSGSTPGLRRSPGEGHDNPLQYFK